MISLKGINLLLFVKENQFFGLIERGFQIGDNQNRNEIETREALGQNHACQVFSSNSFFGERKDWVFVRRKQHVQGF